MSNRLMVARRLSGFTVSAICHALGLAAIVWAGMRPRIVEVHADSPGDKEDQSIVIVDARNTDYQPDDLGVEVDDSSVVALPGFTFDAAKIARRAGSLFPFLSGSVQLRAIAAARDRGTPKRPTNPFGPNRIGAAARPPLVLSDARLQAVVDKSWSRRDRWRAFQPIVGLTREYSADAGALPALLRAYDVQDGLQPYAEAGTRDPRLWSQLGVAADHADFIAFISDFVTKHPSTKSSTELLFLLDQLAQASHDTLVTLLETDPETQLQWTHKANRAAYDTLVSVRSRYLALLNVRGLTLGDSLKRYFEEARLGILDTILETTPHAYRANDARYLIGTIYWRQNRIAEALRSWRQIEPDATDAYATAYSEVLSTMRSMPDGTLDGPIDKKVDVVPIIRALARERSRWVNFSYERLHQFGYRFNTF